MSKNDFSVQSLSELQIKIAHEIVRGGRDTSEVLAENGIGEDEFTKWVTDGAFPAYTSSLAVSFAEAEEPFVWSKLLSLIRGDNVQAIKLYFSLKEKKQNAEKHACTADTSLDELRNEIFGEEDGL